VRCSNVDDALAFEIAGADPICCSYDGNRFEEGDRLKEGRTFGPRVEFGGEGGEFGFRSLRLFRDLYYTPRGTHGVTAPEDLGPDEYFVLGRCGSSGLRPGSADCPPRFPGPAVDRILHPD
jgi:hypothetical protein